MIKALADTLYLILMIATMTMAWLATAQVFKSATRVNLKQNNERMIGIGYPSLLTMVA
jgi:hypothetical protein